METVKAMVEGSVSEAVLKAVNAQPETRDNDSTTPLVYSDSGSHGCHNALCILKEEAPVVVLAMTEVTRETIY